MKYLTLLILLILSHWAAANINLNLTGVGLYSDLRAPYFYSALYTDIASLDPGVIASESNIIRMEFKIVADSISKRRFYKLMNEMVVINNNEQALNSHVNNMVEFMGLLNGKLLKGDHIVIDNSDGETRVVINGIDVLVISDKSFVKLLLNGWIGRLPPTPDFRKDLLSGENSPHLADYFTLEFSPERLAVIKAWDTPLKKSMNEQHSIEQEDNKALALLELDKAELVKKQNDREKKLSNDQDIIALKRENEKKIMLIEEKNKKQREARLAKINREKQARKKALKERQLAESNYYRKLIVQANKSVVFPKRFSDRGFEGLVKVRVSIDDQGKVQDVEVVQSSDNKALDKLALNSTKRAAPFPMLPKTLSLNDGLYDFTIPYRFVINP
jgi:protein TonB